MLQLPFQLFTQILFTARVCGDGTLRILTERRTVMERRKKRHHKKLPNRPPNMTQKQLGFYLLQHEAVRIKAPHWLPTKLGDCMECLERKPGSKGYVLVNVRCIVNGKPKRRLLYAHHLTWCSYNNRSLNSELYLRHLCSNKACINPEHMAEGTHQENLIDVHASDPARSFSAGTVLCMNDIPVIRKCIDAGERYVDIGLEFGVSASTISRIANRQSWWYA